VAGLIVAWADGAESTSLDGAVSLVFDGSTCLTTGAGVIPSSFFTTSCFAQPAVMNRATIKTKTALNDMRCNMVETPDGTRLVENRRTYAPYPETRKNLIHEVDYARGVETGGARGGNGPRDNMGTAKYMGCASGEDSPVEKETWRGECAVMGSRSIVTTDCTSA